MIPGQLFRWRDPIRATLRRLPVGDLRENLILALIWQESIGDPWAWNPEGHYKYLWNVKLDAKFRPVTPAELAENLPPKDFPCLGGDSDQEWWGQRASWGLMQLMGGAARERGFRGVYLPAILEPYINLEYGIKHLWWYAYQCGNRNTENALLRWNGGGDPGYPDKVLSKLAEIERA